jgi:hypothetical protein
VCHQSEGVVFYKCKPWVGILSRHRKTACLAWEVPGLPGTSSLLRDNAVLLLQQGQNLPDGVLLLPVYCCCCCCCVRF